MAMFMLNPNVTICVKATELSHADSHIIAWDGEDIVAIFKESELIGCWLERVDEDGKSIM